MKKLFSLFIMALLVVSVMPAVLATSIGTGVDIEITPEEFGPQIWMCDNRVVLDDPVQAGRTTDGGENLTERVENYAFEGEQIKWTVLVMDKNKIEEIEDVVATIGSEQGTGNDIEVECHEFTGPAKIPNSCNARLGEEKLTDFDPATMQYYECVFTVETPDSMYGEYWITIEAISVDGEDTIDENEYWFLNPVIALSIDGDLTFDEVRPGSVSYSDTILVGNDADEGSGVLLDMFISGTDFYDSSSSGARCPVTNHLKLSNSRRSQMDLGPGIQSNGWHKSHDCQVDQAVSASGTLEQRDDMDHLCYYAVNGAYSTAGDPNADAEGYRPIVYSDEFTRDFYNDAEIIGMSTSYSPGNVLAPGAEMAITFKLGLPEPCVGNFDTGQIYFWGEAI